MDELNRNEKLVQNHCINSVFWVVNFYRELIRTDQCIQSPLPRRWALFLAPAEG
jgi:hypothetical protein